MVTINVIERPEVALLAPLKKNFTDLLGERERLSVERTRKDKDKIEKILGWVMCRTEASRRCGVNPADIRIAFHEKGKPFLLDFPKLQFNITHGGNIIAVAFCNDHEIGIDVEAADRKVNTTIAERFFTPAEADFLQNCPSQQRSNNFLRLWTIKEAYLKMTGDGLSKPLNSFEIRHIGNEIKIFENEVLQNCAVFQDETDPKHIITVCIKGNKQIEIKKQWMRFTEERLLIF